MSATSHTPDLEFPIHTLASAPEASRRPLQELKDAVGMVPNLAGAMAESPTLISGFVALRSIYQSGSFSPGEREVISLTNAVENGCHYCRAIHSAFALQAGVAADAVRALRQGESPDAYRLKALSDFARAIVRNRGHAAPAVFESFLAAGFSKAQALEVLAAVALSSIANYAGHITHPPLDEPLRAHA